MIRMCIYFKENWIGILVSIATGVLVTILCSFFKEIYDKFRLYGRSKFTGYWETHILDKQGNILKIDYCELQHNRYNGEIKGRIIREVPDNQNTRKWKCNGVLQNEKIIMSFWAEDGIKSDGSGYLFLVDDYTFEGLYMHTGKNNNISNVKVKSQKVMDSTKIKKIKIGFKTVYKRKKRYNV